MKYTHYHGVPGTSGQDSVYLLLYMIWLYQLIRLPPPEGKYRKFELFLTVVEVECVGVYVWTFKTTSEIVHVEYQYTGLLYVSVQQLEVNLYIVLVSSLTAFTSLYQQVSL